MSVPNSRSSAVGEPRPLRRATRRGMLVAAGLSMYVASFFLLTVGDFRRLLSPPPGYCCAELALIYPFSEEGRSLFREKPIEYLALLGSGLINPVFLTTFFLHLFRVRLRAHVVLRKPTVLIIPLSWIVFRYDRFYPREGYVRGVVDMLLRLFAVSDAKLRHPAEQTA